MRRNLIVPALAALAAIPTTQALELKDDDASIKFGIRLQSRVEITNASDANGDDLDIWHRGDNGGTTEEPQTINFMVRRARLYMKGKYTGGWKWQLTLMADGIGRQGSEDRGDVGVRYATVGKEWKVGDLKHAVTFGLTKPQMLSSHTDSSSRFLFYDQRLANRVKTEDRVMGLEYKISAPLFKAYARLSEAGDTDEQNGYLVTLRVETGLSEDMAIKKRAESYVGKESGGFKHQLGVGLGFKTESSDLGSGDDNGDAATTITVDYLIHYDQWTALFDFAYVTFDEKKSNGDDDIEMAIAGQVGYAIPMDGYVVEPALRISLLDKDVENEDETGTYLENGRNSGVYLEGGVNVYLDGHSNKLGFYITHYTPEEGDGDAVIVRAQHQLNF